MSDVGLESTNGPSSSGGKATVVPGSDEVSTFRSEGVGRRSRCLVRVGRRFTVSAGRVRPQRRRGCRVGLRFNVSRRSRCGGQTIARSWRLRLGDPRERRPTRHARVRVSLGSRRAALNGEAADRPHLPIAELSPSPTARWVDAARPFVPARSVGHFAAQSDCPASDWHESALRTHLSRLPVRARRAVALAQAVYAPSSATPAARHLESGASVAG